MNQLPMPGIISSGMMVMDNGTQPTNAALAAGEKIIISGLNGLALDINAIRAQLNAMQATLTQLQPAIAQIQEYVGRQNQQTMAAFQANNNNRILGARST